MHRFVIKVYDEATPEAEYLGLAQLLGLTDLVESMVRERLGMGAELPPAQPPGEWRRADTAPRDGARILAVVTAYAHPPFVAIVRWMERPSVMEGWVKGWVTSPPDSDFFLARGEVLAWMPLPEAP